MNIENVYFTAGRKPPVPFGLNGRSISGSVVPSPTAGPGNTRILTPPDPRMYERETPMSIYSKRNYLNITGVSTTKK